MYLLLFWCSSPTSTQLTYHAYKHRLYRFALPLIHVIPGSRTHSVPLYLKPQCDRILGEAGQLRPPRGHDQEALVRGLREAGGPDHAGRGSLPARPMCAEVTGPRFGSLSGKRQSFVRGRSGKLQAHPIPRPLFSRVPHATPVQYYGRVGWYGRGLTPGGCADHASEKDAELAQKLGQLLPFLTVFLQECMGQLASFGPT